MVVDRIDAKRRMPSFLFPRPRDRGDVDQRLGIMQTYRLGLARRECESHGNERKYYKESELHCRRRVLWR
jgi:hypothetical protein